VIDSSQANRWPFYQGAHFEKYVFPGAGRVLALTFAGLAPSAQPLNYSFRDVSQNGAVTAEQLGAFQAAANFWSSKLTDPSRSTSTSRSPASGRTLSVAPVRTLAPRRSRRFAIDSCSTRSRHSTPTAVANLQAGPALTLLATQGDLTSCFDNDGSTNNTLLGLTTANAKAMGYAVGTNVANPDANITFATGFAGDFVYTRASRPTRSTSATHWASPPE
jgi:hypothetical protein